MEYQQESRLKASSAITGTLDDIAQEFLEARERVPTGFRQAETIEENKKRIQSVLGATEADWSDWRWQLRNRISSVDVLEQILNLTDQERADITRVGAKFRWAFTPYYASLMDRDDSDCPVRRQMIPDVQELDMTGRPDFSGEAYTSPAPKLVRWYPDRVAVNTTNICAGFCRHCLRRRFIGETDTVTKDEDLVAALEYIGQHQAIRDVLFTGGDPLTFPDNKVDWLLTELGKIEHVEIKRLGTRLPITMPQRIDAKLVDMLSKHHPLYVNIQVNHPKEITTDAARACDLLSRAGIPLGNQSVLLRGINDDPNVMKVLSHELLKIRVRPYYIYHCQGTIGIAHLRTPVETGVEILENLRGFTSGLAIPSYIITPSVLGKTPLAPQYQVSEGPGHLLLRNWEGIVYEYENPSG
ncbi:MAG: KamA family radical SAM protein [Anaerolineae bacterium]|jgi:lysine 2,3-aminomutase